MNQQSHDVDVEPVVQLTDAPVGLDPVPHFNLPVQPNPSVGGGFDKTKLILPAAILIAAVLISSSLIYTRGTSNTGGTVAKKPPAKVTIDLAGAMILGDPNAPVTVVEYADFQCPFCKRYFQQNNGPLTSEYINTGKVKFVWKDYAFLGQESIWAAEAARCANDQGKFWAYHDYLYNHQGQENSGAFSKVNLKKFAVAIGLNAKEFNSCLDTDKYASAVQQETQAGSAIGVTGTPATFINGQLIVDAQGDSVGAAPFSLFKGLIDQILNK